MSSRGCKTCKHSAVCLAVKDGWKHTYADAFWEAGTEVGLFSAVEGRLLVPERVEAFKTLCKDAERLWKEKLESLGCPHGHKEVKATPQIEEGSTKVDVLLVFPE